MKELGRFSSFGVRYGVFLAFVLVQIPKLWADVFITDVQNRTIRRMFDMPASFGPPFYKEGLIGFAVGAEPRGGCDLIKPPPYNLSDGLSWIAVVRRHECTFGDKVLNAEKSGYDAVIIYNVGSDDLTPMAGGSVHVDIPSCFVGADDGSAILTQFDFTSGFMVTIDNDIPLNPQYYLLPFAIVVGVCFILMVVFMVVKWVRDVRKKRKSRLSYSHLKKIPIKKFKKGDDYDVCAICLEDYEDGEKLRVLPCAHAYHSKCIDPWLLKNKKTCPVCKRKVMPGTDTDSEDEESDDSSGNNDASEITPLLSASNTPGNRGGNTFESSGLPAVFRNQVMTINTDASASEDEETVSPRTLLSLTSTAAVKQLSPGAPRADASSAENTHEVSLNRKKNTVLKITNDDNRSFKADEGIISSSATTLPVNVTASASIAEECSEGAARSLPIETEVLIKNNDKEMDSKTTKANKRDNVV